MKNFFILTLSTLNFINSHEVDLNLSFLLHFLYILYFFWMGTYKGFSFSFHSLKEIIINKKKKIFLKITTQWVLSMVFYCILFLFLNINFFDENQQILHINNPPRDVVNPPLENRGPFFPRLELEIFRNPNLEPEPEPEPEPEVPPIPEPRGDKRVQYNSPPRD